MADYTRTLSALSVLVLTGRGKLDDDLPQKLVPPQMLDAVAKLMSTTDSVDGAGHTLRTLIESKERFAEAGLDGGSERQVGAFVFRTSSKAGWRLATLYLGSE